MSTNGDRNAGGGSSYRVFIEGLNCSVEEFKQNLVADGMSSARADQVAQMIPCYVKKDVSRKIAVQFGKAFQAAGAAVRVEAAGMPDMEVRLPPPPERPWVKTGREEPAPRRSGKADHGTEQGWPEAGGAEGEGGAAGHDTERGWASGAELDLGKALDARQALEVGSAPDVRPALELDRGSDAALGLELDRGSDAALGLELDRTPGGRAEPVPQPEIAPLARPAAAASPVVHFGGAASADKPPTTSAPPDTARDPFALELPPPQPAAASAGLAEEPKGAGREADENGAQRSRGAESPDHADGAKRPGSAERKKPGPALRRKKIDVSALPEVEQEPWLKRRYPHLIVGAILLLIASYLYGCTKVMAASQKMRREMSDVNRILENMNATGEVVTDDDIVRAVQDVGKRCGVNIDRGDIYILAESLHQEQLPGGLCHSGRLPTSFQMLPPSDQQMIMKGVRTCSAPDWIVTIQVSAKARWGLFSREIDATRVTWVRFYEP